MANQIKDLIRRQALAAQLDPNMMIRIAQIESGLNPNAKNPRSSASGLFQFINSTAQNYGLSNPFDPEANAAAAMRFTADNKRGLRQALGRDPTPGEVYFAHQQGLGGARRAASAPDALAVETLGERQVMLNGGTPTMTNRQFMDLWNRKMGMDGQPQPAPRPVTPDQANALGMSQDDMLAYNGQPPANVASRAPQSGDRAMLADGRMGTVSHGGLGIADGDAGGRYVPIMNDKTRQSPDFMNALANFLKMGTPS